MVSTAPATTGATDVGDDRRPLLSFKAILLMNFGFFGIQFSFGLQQTAINPIFQFIGASPEELPLLNLAGPVTGLLIQPLIGAMSDKTWHPRFGRRKPYFVVGAIGCSVVLFLFPFVGALWMAVIGLWLLDASNNTAMEPYRAFISDKLPKSQLARGFLTQSLFVGMGAVLANLSIFAFQKLITGVAGTGIPNYVFVAFWIGAVCSIGSIMISVLSTKEIPPTDEELAELRSRPSGLKHMFGEIADAVRTMPAGMHKIGLVFAFQWYAMVCYWQFVVPSMAESVWNTTDPESAGFREAAGWVGLVNGAYNFVTIFAALALITAVAKLGAKRVHAGSLIIAGLGLFWFSTIDNQYLLFVPMIALGIAWASMLGVPYIMVASMVPRNRLGVYMGIVNMMIVVPMLVQSFTFGWIFENLLGGSGPNVMKFVGVMFGLGAIAMLWVSNPAADEESPLMPLGGSTEITVYDQVIVGSDGTPTSVHAVQRAAGVANAAQAQLIVVSAYNPGGDYVGDQHRRELLGEASARDAIRKSLDPITRGKRVKNIQSRIVGNDPAHALLEAADDGSGAHRSLIVVGNRGLGAEEGQLLGSVPGTVVKYAKCDVLVVQTTGDFVHHHVPPDDRELV